MTDKYLLSSKMKVQRRNTFFQLMTSVELEAWEQRKCAADSQWNYRHL